MLAASLSRSIDSSWLKMEPIRVGPVPPSVRTPDCYVTVTRNDRPLLRVDIYSHGSECFAFEEAIAWRDLIIVGFGCRVYAISVVDRSVVTIEMESYFGRLYPNRDFVLLASGERLFRLQSDRSIRWRSAPLGVDGVVVSDVGLDLIRGDGEWDPPNGWKPFAVSAMDGSLVR